MTLLGSVKSTQKRDTCYSDQIQNVLIICHLSFALARSGSHHAASALLLSAPAMTSDCPTLSPPRSAAVSEVVGLLSSHWSKPSATTRPARGKGTTQRCCQRSRGRCGGAGRACCGLAVVWAVIRVVALPKRRSWQSKRACITGTTQRTQRCCQRSRGLWGEAPLRGPNQSSHS